MSKMDFDSQIVGFSRRSSSLYG